MAKWWACVAKVAFSRRNFSSKCSSPTYLAWWGVSRYEQRAFRERLALVTILLCVGFESTSMLFLLHVATTRPFSTHVLIGRLVGICSKYHSPLWTCLFFMQELQFTFTGQALSSLYLWCTLLSIYCLKVRQPYAMGKRLEVEAYLLPWGKKS